MLDKSKIIELISNDMLPSIRSGDTHPFTEVWMVTVKDRIFVRSGKMVPSDSWFDAFIKIPNGAIKTTGQIIDITAKIPQDLKDISKEVNHAYKVKYGKEHPVLVRLMYRAKLVKNTMEFIIK